MSSKFAIEARGRLRASVTRIFNDRNNFNAYDRAKLNLTKLKLDKADNECDVLNEKVYNLDFAIDGVPEPRVSAELNDCQSYKDKITECQSLLITYLQGSVSGGIEAQNMDGQNNGPQNNRALSQLKRPVAPLPSFTSNEGENLLLFFYQFEETLSKFSYTQYDKLLLLKQQISGKASLLIDSLEAEKQTYDEAKLLLTSALASPEVQKFNVLKQLSELKLSNSGEPFQYIADVRKLMQAIKSLDIKVDDMLAYFVYNGLNEMFKNQLTLVTNCTRPTIEQIIENFFVANERYELARKNLKINKVQSKSEPETLVLSANAQISSNKNPFHNCTLCNYENHAINKCNNFQKPSDKLSRLNKLNGCIKCGNLEHSDQKCNFRFKKSCTMCGRWHFSFLCSERISEPSKNNAGKSYDTNVRNVSKDFKAGNTNRKSTNARVATVDTHGENSGYNWAANKDAETNCHIVCASFFQDTFCDIDSALSTFTVKNRGGNAFIRGLFDIGSQSSFVSDKMLNQLDYVVLNDHVNLTIKGINNVKTCKSKLIEAKLQFGEHKFTVKLLTVPTIDISLNLPQLGKMVSRFVDNGYHLADELLNSKSEVLNNIGLILGADAAHCFTGNTQSFGKSSVFISVKFGILLLGSIRDMLRDSSSLSKTDISNNLPQKEVQVLNVKTSTYAINLGFALETSELAQPVTSQDDHDSTIVTKGLDTLSFDKCSEQVLEDTCSHHLNKEVDISENTSELNEKLVRYLLDSSTRADDGRMIIPLLWNVNVKHLLAQNFNLAKKVLYSSGKKILNDHEKLYMVHNNVKELSAAGIIQKVDNLEQFMAENPTCSFLAHSYVFRPHKETTKIRMVFMSNLAEKLNSNNLSHNQCMYSGPCVNQKLSTALILLRFDEKLLVFDLKKAFCQLLLPESDANKLLFLWYKNPEIGDFTLQAYKNVRCSFGLRCSPTMLMCALYKMLVMDAEADEEKLRRLKSKIYSLTYMDNCAVSFQTSEELIWAYESLNDIFQPYKFELQQHCTNDEQLQTQLGQCSSEKSELFGLEWDTQKDTLSSKKKVLDPNADTKRKVLQSIAQNFDPYNYDGPILNRARLYMHELQCEKNMVWDKKLNPDQQREWRNISAQVNNASPISIPRCVGSRNGSYRLVCFTDASQVIYGCVIYLQNVDTNDVNFILAKNRIVGKGYDSKTIPSLELAAIALGTETLMDVYKELTGVQCMLPVRIIDMLLYTDSLVCLNWMNSHVNKLDKLNKISVFVKNRLDKISKICELHAIQYCFVDGIENPSDKITRPVSHKQLVKSNYISGPSFLTEKDYKMSRPDIMSVTVPNPRFVCRSGTEANAMALAAASDAPRSGPGTDTEGPPPEEP